MEDWVLFAFAAALAQTLRFALQKQLASGLLSAVGATYARFVWASPITLAAVILGSAATDTPWPSLSLEFWLYTAMGGVAQILATVLLVMLFSLRNFAIGVTFKKTEVLLTAGAGALILGDRVGPAGLGAMALGFAGVLLLSRPPDGKPGPRSIMLGLSSGLCFALAGVGYRGAVLAVDMADNPVFQTGWALAMVTTLQLTVMTVWLLARDPARSSPCCAPGAKSALSASLLSPGAFAGSALLRFRMRRLSSPLARWS